MENGDFEHTMIDKGTGGVIEGSSSKPDCSSNERLLNSELR